SGWGRDSRHRRAPRRHFQLHGTASVASLKQPRRHEDTKKKGITMLRLPTRLSEELEDIIHRLIGCCIRVHRELGPGLLESIYVRAVCVELQLAGIPFEVEKSIPVMYRGIL